MNNKKGIINEYTFHFNLDQLRKFQKMEVLVDKMAFFIKFLKINYDTESISFDFESFNNFNEDLWINDMNKYNFKELKNYKVISEDKKIEEISSLDDVSVMKIYKGIKKHIRIKIEIKYPLILMKGLDEFGFKTTETINVEHHVEKAINKKIIFNSLDLTKHVINILKEYNFCRKSFASKRNVRKKTNRQKKNTLRENANLTEKLINTETPSIISGAVLNLKEE